MEVWQEIRENVDAGARRLVSEYGNRLFAAARCLCVGEHDAEELVFRTFDQAIKKIRKYEPSGDFFCWLYAIMLNFRRMDMRKGRPNIVPVGTALDLPEVAGAALPEIDGGVDCDAVLEAVRALSEPIRSVVVLRYFNDCAVEDIARDLSIPAGTVKSRLHTARHLLGEMLKRKGVAT